MSNGKMTDSRGITPSSLFVIYHRSFVIDHFELEAVFPSAPPPLRPFATPARRYRAGVWFHAYFPPVQKIYPCTPLRVWRITSPRFPGPTPFPAAWFTLPSILMG